MPRLQLGNIPVDVEQKDIKNIHLSVYPPNGRVRIAAPNRMNLDTIRVYAISKLGWIKKQQAKIRSQERTYLCLPPVSVYFSKTSLKYTDIQLFISFY